MIDADDGGSPLVKAECWVPAIEVGLHLFVDMTLLRGLSKVENGSRLALIFG